MLFRAQEPAGRQKTIDLITKDILVKSGLATKEGIIKNKEAEAAQAIEFIKIFCQKYLAHKNYRWELSREGTELEDTFLKTKPWNKVVTLAKVFTTIAKQHNTNHMSELEIEDYIRKNLEFKRAKGVWDLAKEHTFFLESTLSGKFSDIFSAFKSTVIAESREMKASGHEDAERQILNIIENKWQDVEVSVRSYLAEKISLPEINRLLHEEYIQPLKPIDQPAELLRINAELDRINKKLVDLSIRNKNSGSERILRAATSLVLEKGIFISEKDNQSLEALATGKRKPSVDEIKQASEIEELTSEEKVWIRKISADLSKKFNTSKMHSTGVELTHGEKDRIASTVTSAVENWVSIGRKTTISEFEDELKSQVIDPFAPGVNEQIGVLDNFLRLYEESEALDQGEQIAGKQERSVSIFTKKESKAKPGSVPKKSSPGPHNKL